MKGEEALLEALRSMPGTSSTLGDDCAIIDRTDEPLLVTVDSLNEGVHFESSTELEDVAAKLVGVNASDVAAMGGTPRWALLAEGSNHDREHRERFVREVTSNLREREIELVGGDVGGVTDDTSRFYSMTLLGVANPGGIMERGSAHPGEKIAVTGALGAPAAVRATGNPPWNENERSCLYHPPNRIAEGQKLVEAGVRSAIDLSDGLLKDLGRVLEASSVGARLDWNAIPLSPLVEERSTDVSDRLNWSLAGGEDFELLFTIPEGRTVPFDNYTVIGETTDEKGLNWNPPLPDELDLRANGYDHLTEGF